MIEVEVKSLIPVNDGESAIGRSLINLGAQPQGIESQKNHYFTDGDSKELLYRLSDMVYLEDHDQMRRIVEEGKNISVRTREIDGSNVRFVMKASIGDDSSANGVARMELDVSVPLTLDELDARIIECGYIYQAKWSRVRTTYLFEDITIAVDKNAGYGYLAEFEIVVPEETDVLYAMERIKAVMGRLGLTELPQDRLERMFAYYNDHWEEYYGTDDIFAVQ